MAQKLKKRICVLLLFLAALLSACTKGPEEAPAVPEASGAPAPEITAAVEISEVMASNKCTLDNGSGAFPDWLELHNTGPEPADISGYWLSCSGDRWQIPALQLAPDGYAVIFCTDGAAGDALSASFGISSKGERITLESPSGTEVDSVLVPAAKADVSVVRTGEGELREAAYATPGYANSPEGYRLFQESMVNDSPLQINEAMVYNEWFLPLGGEYYDWVELKNVSDTPLDLSGYAITDKSANRYHLPERTLEAGELYVFRCTGAQAEGAPFSLNAREDMLFLMHGEEICDYMRLSGLRFGGSYGRQENENGFFYFDAPTPGEENRNGARLIAPKPVLAGNDGVFDGVKSVQVELSADGDIYYTTDGSDPSLASERYTGPLTLTETAVIRAINVEPGALVSDSLDLSFIINEGHTLPVVSMIADPADIFGQEGIYTNPRENWEKQGTLAFYEQGQSFRIGCGIKLHGATSRIAQDKKSFKILFRSRYEGELDYDLFHNGITDFASILLRADQESHFSTLMRDNLMHQIAIEHFPELPAQDYRYSVLYINGEYWGVYTIREAHSEEHYANHYGYDADTVEHWQGKWDAGSTMAQIYQFAINNDLKKEENYAYVAEHLNIESIIAWTILQAYSSNFDINSPNMRFYYSAQDDVTAYALVDLDLGMFDTQGLKLPLYAGYAYDMLVVQLFGSEQFKQQFLTELAQALKGPLSDAAVLERIDALADELRPEIPRDGQRWGCTLKYWEQEVELLRKWVNASGGRAYLFVIDAKETLHLSNDQVEEYFGQILDMYKD